MIGEKSPNLQVRYFLERKPRGIKPQKGLKLLCLLGGGGGPSKSATFLCQSRHGPSRSLMFFR